MVSTPDGPRAGAGRRGRPARRRRAGARRRRRLLDRLDRVVGRDARGLRRAGCRLPRRPGQRQRQGRPAGGLSLVVSGPEETYERGRAPAGPPRQGATYVGEGDVARLVKICHNLFLGVVTQSWPRSPCSPRRAGLPRAAFLEFLNNSVMGSMFTRYKTPAFVNLDFTPTFTPIAAAQGLRPRPGGRARSRRADAGRGSDRRSSSQASVSSGQIEEDFAVLLDSSRPAAPA